MGRRSIQHLCSAGKVISAAYTEAAQFQSGKADISIRLVQVTAQWQFLLFKVNSPVMLQ